MRLLLDTHLLLWGAVTPLRLSPIARRLIEDNSNCLAFSAASMWEITIKRMLGKPDFMVDPHELRLRLLDSSFEELPITSEHAMYVANLPPLHKDPFDRMLIAQSLVEGVTLLSADALILQYSGPIRRV